VVQNVKKKQVRLPCGLKQRHWQSRAFFVYCSALKISLVTVCYNSAATLPTALESVLRQTHPDLEYIVVDGASTDGSQRVIESFEKKFAGRMRWLSEPDRGMYDAINKGIARATGEVVGILNADDAFSSCDVLARVARAFDPPRELDAVYGDVRFVKNATDVSLENFWALKTLRHYSSRHWRPWMLQWGFMPPHPSVYIRKKCFEKLGLYATDYHIAADYALLVRFLRKAKLRIAYVPMCFADMRVGGKSTRDWRSNLLLNREIVRGNREAGYFCCLPMLAPKYLFKIFEFIIPKIKGRRECPQP